MSTPNTILLYVASSNGKFADPAWQDDPAGIYVLRLDLASGALEKVDITGAIASSQYLTLAPDGRHLYATRYVRGRAPGAGGEIHAFAVDSGTGALRHLNHLPTRGDSPCYVAVDGTGRYVMVANYTGVNGQGSACLFAVGKDGELAADLDCVRHPGSSVNTARQSCSHPHLITADPTNRLVLIPDLGIDKVMLYRIVQDRLVPADIPPLTAVPGAGPRHLAFHPTAPYLYVINELDSTITAYVGHDAGFERRQIVPTLPDGFGGDNTCADIHVHPSGRWLYGSNRGHDSIVVYAISAATGALTYVGHQMSLGAIPRGFAIDPTGRLLIVANQRSHTVVTFQIEDDSGRLQPTGSQLTVPAPIRIATFCLSE